MSRVLLEARGLGHQVWVEAPWGAPGDARTLGDALSRGASGVLVRPQGPAGEGLLQQANTVADIFLPLYHRSGGLEGRVAFPMGEAEALRGDLQEARPNLVPWVEGTQGGLALFGELCARGLPALVGPLFSPSSVRRACQLWRRGRGGWAGILVGLAHLAGAVEAQLAGNGGRPLPGLLRALALRLLEAAGPCQGILLVWQLGGRRCPPHGPAPCLLCVALPGTASALPLPSLWELDAAPTGEGEEPPDLGPVDLDRLGERLTRQRAHPRPARATPSALPERERVSLRELGGKDAVRRLWSRDYSLWRPRPQGVADRLGWLTLPHQMGSLLEGLEAFAREVREEGVRDVVLLGMGGSSLGPEVLWQAFGPVPGHPRLWVLDSTIPSQVGAVARGVDPCRALFLVSSKSGTTVETLALFRYFWSLAREAVGEEGAGGRFAAITDPGTPLEALARERGFRRVFLNPPDVGGRYSVLSLFGLVPAALMGVDTALLLERATAMALACRPGVPEGENPGAWLGALLAYRARRGRDKLTLVASPSIAGFGLWLEQLVAESTGKDGRGIVPVAGEPLAPPDHYADDRLFVYLRLEGDDNAGADRALERLARAGHPVVTLRLRDRYDLGAEFFRWEFAVALAGALLGINPFDQPDVQASKDLTARLLEGWRSRGGLPPVEAPGTLRDLLARARPGDYLALLVYARPSPQLERMAGLIRAGVMARLRLATTFGYGPRYLHSTGQLHKGGPNNGLFLLLTAEEGDLPVPGEAWTFGTLAMAQALGDLQALQRRGRRVVHLHLGRGVLEGLGRLAEEVA